MELWVAGKLIKQWKVETSSYQDYQVRVPSYKEGQEVAVAFTNDFWIQGIADRNLWVDYIKIGDRVIQAEGPNIIYDRGAGKAAFDSKDTLPGQERMNWNGALRTIKNSACQSQELTSYTQKIWRGSAVFSCDDNALKITGTDADAEAYSPLISVSPNTAYTVSYKVKTAYTSINAQVYGRVIAAEYSSNAKEEDPVTANRIRDGRETGTNLGGINDWAEKTYTFTTSPTTHYLRLRAAMALWGTAEGAVWYKDLRVVKSGQEENIIFQDNFENNLLNWDVYAAGGNKIELSSDQKYSGQKSLKLHYTGNDYLTASHTFSSPKTGAVTVWFYDNLDSTMGTFVGIFNNSASQAVMLGVNTNKFPNTYFYRAGSNSGNSDIDTRIQRTKGWHKFELVSTPKGSYGKIDGINLAFLPSAVVPFATIPPVNTELIGFSKIILASTWGLAGDGYYDDLQLTNLEQLPSSIADRERALLKAFLSEPPYYDANWQPYRQKGNRATILAVVGKADEEAKNLIRDIAQNYSSWDKTWGSPLPATDFGIASWLMWNKLDGVTRALVKKAITEEANFWADRIEKIKNTPDAPDPLHIGGTGWTYYESFSGYEVNSRAEENAWTASFLALAANMFPGETNSHKWDAAAKTYAFHALTTGENYNGITTQTLHSDYLLDNHGYHPHPNYAISASIGELARGALFYYKTGKPIPDEFKHNVLNVWNAHKQYIDFSTYLWQNCNMAIKFRGKDDWDADSTIGDNAFAFVSLLSGDNSFISDLTAYEYYILRDYKGSYPRILKDYNNEGGYFGRGAGLKYLLDSVAAKRDAVALMFFDPSITLPTTE
jgi:hypothetical protein